MCDPATFSKLPMVYFIDGIHFSQPILSVSSGVLKQKDTSTMTVTCPPPTPQRSHWGILEGTEPHALRCVLRSLRTCVLQQ